MPHLWKQDSSLPFLEVFVLMDNDRNEWVNNPKPKRQAVETINFTNIAV